MSVQSWQVLRVLICLPSHSLRLLGCSEFVCSVRHWGVWRRKGACGACAKDALSTWSCSDLDQYIYIYIQLVNTSEYNFIGREHVQSDSATLGGCWWSAVGFFLGSNFQCWLESRVEIIVFVFEYGYIVNHDYVPSHYNEVHNYSFSGIYKHLFRYTTKHILGLTNRNTMNKACARDPSNLIWLILVVSNIVCSRPYLN